ncbi:hypothetical protein P879_07734 [Paragonimus westermani]|uniref:Uncharacterized protein n=1 Tax=Paragonimus westermani TaxID=34504 RepID=A0A8T0DAT3_9TREM|nr:hypothetical protein P879_07734 [Paragonimus westermani]
MIGVLLLFLRLFILIGIKLLWKVYNIAIHVSRLAIQPGFLVLISVAQVFGFSPATKRSRRISLYSLHAKPKRIGIAILTRLPIAERASISVREDGISDQLHASLRHPGLLERILTELAATCISSWLCTENFPPDLIVSRVLLVHHRNYTSAFTLSGWLSILPNHELAKQWYIDRGIHQRSASEVKSPLKSDALSKRFSELVSLARYNANHKLTWEDPDIYYSSRIFDQCRNDCLAPTELQASELGTVSSPIRNPIVEYVTVAGLGFSGLLEVALRAALRTNADYVIVLNPRALNIQPKHISVTAQLLTGCSFAESAAVSGSVSADSVDVVLGVTKSFSASLICRQNMANSAPSSSSTPYESALPTGPAGLYLLGIRGGRMLTLRARTLTASVDWCSPSTAARVWANLAGRLTSWTTVCLRERLEEVQQATDLLALEHFMHIPPEQFLVDKLSVIIPVGPGHPDDAIDPDDMDGDCADLFSSKALTTTLEIIVQNASGERAIEIILIHSQPPKSLFIESGVTNTSRFRSIRLRPMITVTLHHFDSSWGSDNSATADSSVPPRRGELIRYAVDRWAKGTVLVFLEPGIQLPVNWDSAVYHSLQRPGVGMGCFAFRSHLDEKYVNRKSLKWAINSWLANYLVNVQTRWSEIPIVRQPCFIYAHYLACLGGYPRSSRTLHPIDLAIACHRHLGRVVVTRSSTTSAGVPASFALRHGAVRTALYTVTVAIARYLGATESELTRALTRSPDRTNPSMPFAPSQPRLPLVQPHYLDGY